MSFFNLATAQVTIEVLDKAYHASMNAVEARWTKLTRMMNQTQALGGLGKAAAGVMQIVGALAKVVSAIPTAFFSLAKAGVSALQAISKHGVPLVGGVFGAMRGAIKVLTLSAPAMGQAFATAFTVMRNAFGFAYKALRASDIGKIFAGLGKEIGTVLAPVGAAIASRMGKIGGRIGHELSENLIKPVVSAFAFVGGKIAAGLGKAAGAVGKVGSKIGHELSENLIKPVGSAFAFVFKSVANSSAVKSLGTNIGKVMNIGGGLLGGTGRALGKAGGWIGTGLGVAGKELGTAFGGLGSNLGAFMGPGLQKAFANVMPLITKVGGAIGSVFGPAIHKVGSAFGTAFSGVKNVLGGLAQTAVSVMGKAAKTVGGLFSSALGAVGGLAGGALKIGGMGLGALGLAGGVTLGAIAQEAATAESRFVNLQRVLGGSVEATVVLNERFKTLASTMGGMPIEEIYKIADVGARLGIAGDELGLFTTDLARMSMVLKDIPTEEAATRISRLLAVFQRSTKDAGRMASALNALDMASTATARDILDVTSRLSGTSAVLGMTPQKAMALSTALRQAGVPIETAGTSITQILGRMASKKDVGKFAKTAGMDKASWEKLLVKDPLEAIIGFEKGLQKLDTISQVRVLDELHMDGQRVRSTLLQLGRVLPQLNQYVKIAETEWESMSSIQKGAAMVADMLGSKYELLVNNFHLMIQALGAGLMPMFKAGADALIFLFRDLTKFFENKGGVIAEWASKIGDALAIVGVLFRSRWKIWEYVVVTMTEKWEQFTYVIKRGAKLAGEWMVWGFKAGISVVMTMFSDLEFFLYDLFEQIGDKLPKIINNMVYNAFQNLADPVKIALAALNPAMAGALAKMQPVAVEPIRPGFDMFGNPARNVGAAAGAMPGGFGGIAQGMPNRQEQLAGIAGGIRMDMARGVFERQQAMRQMNLQDENARRQAAGLPPLTRKQAEQLRRRNLRAATRKALLPPSPMRAAQAIAEKQKKAQDRAAASREKRARAQRAIRIKRGVATSRDVRQELADQLMGGFGAAGKNLDFANLGLDLSLPEGRQKLAEDLKPAIQSLDEAARLMVDLIRRQGFMANPWD